MSLWRCSTCGAELLWVKSAAGPVAVCPRPYCPGHDPEAAAR